MSTKKTDVSKTHSSHNYLNTQKSNAHTKVNGNLVQLWFGSAGSNIASLAPLTRVNDGLRNIIGVIHAGLIKPKLLDGTISNILGNGQSSIKAIPVYKAKQGLVKPAVIAALMLGSVSAYALDSDNDGIDDSIENTCVSPARIVLGSFYNEDFGTGGTLTSSHPNVPTGAASVYVGISSQQTGDWFKMQANGHLDASGSTNGRYLIIDNPNQALIYDQDNIAVTVNQAVEFSVFLTTAEAIVPDGEPNIKLKILDADGNTLAEYDSGDMTDEDIWVKVALSFTSPTSTIRLQILTNNLVAAGNVLGLDSIEIANVACDSDGDGIYDHLDLDSDNDGYSDHDENIAGSSPTDPASTPATVAGTDYTTGLQVGSYADPAHPTIAEIQVVIDTVNASNAGLAEVAEDIAGNANANNVTAEQLNTITGVSGAVTGTDYTEGLMAGSYADPANPTAAEIQAVVDTVNASHAGLAEVVEDIAGNANTNSVTAKQLNAITGVSGAVAGIDYTTAFKTGSYADPVNPTPAEIQAVIDEVNQKLGQKPSTDVEVETGLSGGNTAPGLLGLLGLIVLIRRKFFKK